MHVLTLIAPAGALTDAVLARARAALSPAHTAWLAAGEAADLFLPTEPAPTRLAEALADQPIDAILQPVCGRRKCLLVADMDSTLVRGETLDDLAALAGVGAEVAALTRQSMEGTADFSASLARRVALLRGLAASALDQVWADLRLNPGAEALFATMRAHGAVTAIVSGGFSQITERLAARLGATCQFANRLEIEAGRLTGRLVPPLIDAAGKRDALRDLAAAHGLGVQRALAVGDGANDGAMLAESGMGVAYHAKPVLARAARAHITHTDLSALLFLQGYTRPFVTSQSQDRGGGKFSRPARETGP